MKKIYNWNEVDVELGCIADAEQKLAVVAAQAEEQIAKVRANMKRSSEILVEAIRYRTEVVQNYVLSRRDELDPGLKSRKLTFGTVGFRNVVKLRWPKRLETLIEKLRANKLLDYIRVTESVNKELIFSQRADLPLDKLGISEKTEEHFFIETKKETV